ncbi:MAG: hypothetical protein H6721_08340 [Sandaracinus sp.]|nr:hypothetical protein [Myxococcales bacterium]MCB9602708.1 hypothetical protein [Sandaracinus sp.]MCB9617069.1 hypothetical protein [Sandaracinus sp.]MCB9623494.1 hypothetical protein [Sandaracinus sp.]MCB9632124.1 hypothetical protein [Sandaracinus sp.]
MRIGPTATTLAVFLAALCAWPTHAQPLAMRSPLSDAERAQLDRGSIVLRRVRERRGPLTLIGGTSFQVVDLPPSAVWRALHDDPDHIRRMLPQVHSARQLREEANLRVMHFEHRVGVVRASYAMRFQYDDTQKAVLFQLDESRPHTIRAGWGFMRVRRWGENQTLLSFGAMVDVGEGLISGLVRPTLHEWILKIPWTLKQYVEGAGRSRYES